MLYDPRWEKPSLDGLINWLRLQPARRFYDWRMCVTCVVGRYLADVTTNRNWGVVYDHINVIGDREDYFYIGAGHVNGITATGKDEPLDPRWTYGQALERALEVQKARALAEVA